MLVREDSKSSYGRQTVDVCVAHGLATVATTEVICESFPKRFYDRIKVKSILNRSIALTACGLLAGMISICPAERRNGLPSIVNSASPSRSWTMASNGAVCSLRACPRSNANTVTVPVGLSTMVRLTIEPA